MADLTGRKPVSIIQRTGLTGFPDNFGTRDVDLVKKMLSDCLEPLGGLEALVPPGAGVVVKVNAGFGSPPGRHTTDPRVVEALIRLLQGKVRPARIVILESAAEHHMLRETGMGNTTRQCYSACGIEEVARRTGAELLTVEEDRHIFTENPRGMIYRQMHIPQTLLENDILIYVPHLKTHISCGVTLGIKLGQGCLPYYEQRRFHRCDLPQKLVDLLHVVYPRLTIIDGLWAQQGQGPTSPYEADIIKDMNLLVAGTDVVAVDAVGSAIMGYHPFEVETTRLAHVQGLGTGELEAIQLSGCGLDTVRRSFRRPDQRLAGVFSNINFFLGGACEGCLSHLRIYLDQFQAAGVLQELKRPVNIIVGFAVEVPDQLEGPVLVVGDCTAGHRQRGVFVPGCCPLAKIFRGLMEVIALGQGG
ncbi:MAG: DUF362 domain-containing protein [Peptococcaceae bacterium]|nr:DUF362 domain-containing protein [Peptococcaceae bacterium]